MFPLRGNVQKTAGEDDLKADDSGVRALLQVLAAVLLLVGALIIGLYFRGMIRF